MKDSVYDFVSWFLEDREQGIEQAIHQHVKECFKDPTERQQAFDDITKAVKEHPDLHWPGLMHDYPR